MERFCKAVKFEERANKRALPIVGGESESASLTSPEAVVNIPDDAADDTSQKLGKSFSMSSIDVTSSSSTCTVADTDDVVLDEDVACIGIWFNGHFTPFLMQDGEPLTSLSRDDGEAVVPYLHLDKKLFSGLVRQSKPVMSVSACLTYGLIKEGMDDHYGKHTRRQWKVPKMVFHARR